MNDHYPFVNPPLPYPSDSLEPYIDAKTMTLHHDRHLQTYVDNLNNLLKDLPQYHNESLEQLLMYIDYLPAAIQTPIKNNAGGVYNHIFYFSNLAPANDALPSNQLLDMINWEFGGFPSFQKKLTDAALSVFGSGYAWLVLLPNRSLSILTTPNQDTPLPMGACPILNLDVWEHAYYLKHYNVRAEYIQDWFKVVNWEKVNQNLLQCLSK